jgi:hypothetical protein
VLIYGKEFRRIFRVWVGTWAEEKIFWQIKEAVSDGQEFVRTILVYFKLMQRYGMVVKGVTYTEYLSWFPFAKVTNENKELENGIDRILNRISEIDDKLSRQIEVSERMQEEICKIAEMKESIDLILHHFQRDN